jgi:hypothetical protein
MNSPVSIDQPPFGTLTWDGMLGRWENIGVGVAMFGGRLLRIGFSTGGEENEAPPIPATMLAAAEAMLRLDPSALDKVTPHVWANYREFRDAVGDDVPAIDPSDDIWAHVQPSGILVEERDGHAYVSFECNCDWEVEHGLMLVLRDGVRWVKVSAYDGHLTDGRAYAKPFLDDWIADPVAELPIRTFDEIMAMPDGPKRR